MLERLQAALAALGRCYHYVAEPNAVPPYMVWMEDGDNDLLASNIHAERCFTGTTDLFTKAENDPLVAAIPQALERIGASYYLNGVDYEDDTGLIHFEWVWEVI